LNTDADAGAKEAAERGANVAEFRDVVIGRPQPATTATNRRTPSSLYILTLYLNREDLFDAIHSSLISQIASKATIERATTPEATLNILSRDIPPSVILVADTALAQQRKL